MYQYVQRLQQQIRDRNGELARARANQRENQEQLREKEELIQQMRKKLNSKESEMEQVIADCRAQVQIHESAIEQLRKENRELRQKQGPQKLELVSAVFTGGSHIH